MKVTEKLRVLLLQNCQIESFGLYERYLVENGFNCDVVHTYREPLPSPEHYDLVFVGGTPDAAYHRDRIPYLARVYEVLSTAIQLAKPCFGVCCGAQLLAELLGGRATASPEMEIGGYEVALTAEGREDPLLDGFPERFPVFHWHGDTFELPPSARLLAEGEECKNQFFRAKNVAGVLFHLETTSELVELWAREYARELLEVGKTGADVIAECRVREPEMRKLAERLIGNYLRLVGKDARGPVDSTGRLPSSMEGQGITDD